MSKTLLAKTEIVPWRSEWDNLGFHLELYRVSSGFRVDAIADPDITDYARPPAPPERRATGRGTTIREAVADLERVGKSLLNDEEVAWAHREALAELWDKVDDLDLEDDAPVRRPARSPVPEPPPTLNAGPASPEMGL